MFYVYVYLDPRKIGRYQYDNFLFTYEPFYVGKGKEERYLTHLQSTHLNKKSYKSNKIKKIIAEGYTMKKYIQKFDCATEEQAFELEKRLISLIGRYDLRKGPLTNLTDGGEGSSGHICTEQKREKNRIASTGRVKNITDKTYEEFFGEEKAKEIKEKQSRSHKGKKKSKEHAENIRKAKKGKSCSEETKRRISETAKKNKRTFVKICENCQNEFIARTHNRKCCDICR